MICLHCPCCPHLFTVNDLIIKEKVAVWSGVSWHPLPKEQDKCTNTRTHTGTHTISVSSNLSYEIFITALCAQLQCHALRMLPGLGVMHNLTHTGCKVFLSCRCPTSSAFSISLSVALTFILSFFHTIFLFTSF